MLYHARLIVTVTEMSRKSTEGTVAKVQQTTTKEGESSLRDFAPTC